MVNYQSHRCWPKTKGADTELQQCFLKAIFQHQGHGFSKYYLKSFLDIKVFKNIFFGKSNIKIEIQSYPHQLG